jgi:hypothetical protein
MINCLQPEQMKTLIKANISASRLNVIAAGEDSSVEKIQMQLEISKKSYFQNKISSLFYNTKP